MARPFRFQPPSLPGQTVARPRLLDRLALRWQHRVTTVVAGPGFGKTTLLMAARGDASPVGRRDFWLSCEPGDEAADHLLAGLCDAVGTDIDAGVDGLLAAVWSAAPSEVCIVFDDVHEIPPGSSGAVLLGRLTTNLAANAHLVFSSRDAVPVPVARLAAAGQLLRFGESDLVFDENELAAFAAQRAVTRSLLDSTGGWPALAELTASAGEDLVLHYLMEEVLSGIGAERTRLLARFLVVGGGDDEIASALGGPAATIESTFASVPLVQRSGGGWATLHPLWGPALRGHLTPTDTREARRTVAQAHSRRGRLDLAATLFAEAEDWEGVLGVMRAAEPRAGSISPVEFGRWYRSLPREVRNQPYARISRAFELKAHSPTEALVVFDQAGVSARERSDVDAELASIAHGGELRWLLNDVGGLLALHERAGELAKTGSVRAGAIAAVGTAAIAHLLGDSAGVFGALSETVIEQLSDWQPMGRWLRSVAHRRNGSLAEARAELDRIDVVPLGWSYTQGDIARLRIDWLEGDVDLVVDRWPDLYGGFRRTGETYLARENGLELAAKLAWLGHSERARALVDANPATAPHLTNILTQVLESIARAAIAVDLGDEADAAEILRETLDRAAPLGGPASWIWRDRAAIALVYVLRPETRTAWADEPLGSAHTPGLALGAALAAARVDDLDPVRTMTWPPHGIVRANLPLRWAAELCAAGIAAGNPPPDDLLGSLGPSARSAMQAVASTHGRARLVVAATAAARALPSPPSGSLRIAVLGPIEVHHDDDSRPLPELRRARVRELLCLVVAMRRVRREAISDQLWPEVTNPAHNLRVTLNYLQRVLQPDRAAGDPPFYLRVAADWLELVDDDRLRVDAWELVARLDDAEAAERAGDPTGAVDAYRDALRLWRGEPFADVPYADWVVPFRERLRTRYVGAAIRCGELLLAARDAAGARDAGERALVADGTGEPAYRLVARAQIADGDRPGARRTMAGCAAALKDLGVEPDPQTLALIGLTG